MSPLAPVSDLMHTKRCEAAGGEELYMMSHSNYRIAILFGTKSCWMERNKLLYIIRFLCLCYVHVFTISS